MAEKEKSIRPFADASNRKEAQSHRDVYSRHMNRQIYRYIDNV